MTRYANRIRIIGGKYKRKSISVLTSQKLRPTIARTRETLFNWLEPYIKGSKCLDLFAGSGILSFESLSRGAAWTTMVDNNKQICDNLRKHAVDMKLSSTEVIWSDSLEWLKAADNKNYDLIFLDPPFGTRLVEESLGMLKRYGLKKDVLIYIESKDKVNAINSDLEMVKSSKTKTYHYGLFSLSR